MYNNMRCHRYFTLSLTYNIICIHNQTSEKERLSHKLISSNKLIRRMRPVEIFQQIHMRESVDVLGQCPEELGVGVGGHQVRRGNKLIALA
jgi:hypothetical protein